MVLVSALFISLVFLTVPMAAADLGVDASWCAVLNWAHERGLQFGRNIVFTYGPLGYLIAPYTLTQPSWLLILANEALCFHVVVGLCLVAWRLAWPWRWLLLGTFVVEGANAELRADLALEVGLLCWGLLGINGSGRTQKLCVAGLLLLATFAALSKVVYLFVAGFSLCAITCCLMAGNELWFGLLVVPTFIGLLLLGWAACGQAISCFVPYVINGFLISLDYDQAAALEGVQILRLFGLLLGMVGLAAVLLGACGQFGVSGIGARFRRAALLIWLTGLLLFAWKHSLVRLDRFHFMELAVFAPVVTLSVAATPGPGSRIRTVALAVGIACCVLSFAIIEFAFMPSLPAPFSQVISQFAHHARWLIFPAECRRQLEPELEARRNEAQLPAMRQIIGAADVDVFGFHQAHALLNGLNYRPRPVFQSYAAYHRQLAGLNESFYLSESAPQFVLFELSALEHRFPVLDDGLALRALLINYQRIAEEGPFVLLKRKSAEPAKLTPLAEGTVDANEKVDLRRYAGENLWLELGIEPTPLGRVVKFAYRPPVIRLSVWEDSPTGIKRLARRRAAPPLLASGFVASPFLITTGDTRDLYDAKPVLPPTGFSVEPEPGSQLLWNKRIQFRVYRIENRIGGVGKGF